MEKNGNLGSKWEIPALLMEKMGIWIKVGDPSSATGGHQESGMGVRDPGPAPGGPSESLQEDLENSSENGEQGMRRTWNSTRLGPQKWRKMDPEFPPQWSPGWD